MENKLKSFCLPLLVLSSAFFSCEKIDIKGMVINEDSADERFLQSKKWNDTNLFTEITLTKEDYSLLAMGDSHIGNCINLDVFFNEAVSKKASAVLLAGDLTNGDYKEYIELIKHLPDKKSLPYFIMAGNHDMNFNGWEYYKKIFKTSTYYFTVKTPVASDLYICLETGSATLGKKQLNWLSEILKTKRSEFRYCVIITHNNFFRKRRTEASLMNPEEIHVLLDLFIRYNVNMEITAHDHHRYSESLGGTRYIVMPALTEDADQPGYLQLNVRSTGLNYEFIDL